MQNINGINEMQMISNDRMGLSLNEIITKISNLNDIEKIVRDIETLSESNIRFNSHIIFNCKFYS